MTDEQRWALADRVARGEGADEVRAAYRQRLRLAIAGIAVLFLVAVVVGLALVHGHHRSDNHVPRWSAALGLVLILIGIVIEVRGIIRVRGLRGWQRWSESPMVVLRRAQRRQVLRQVLGKSPADPARLTVTRSVAARLQRRAGQDQVQIGLIVLMTGNALTDPSRGRIGYLVVLGVALLWSAILVRRYAARSDAFLAAHPA